jgi:hypothetical protein
LLPNSRFKALFGARTQGEIGISFLTVLSARLAAVLTLVKYIDAEELSEDEMTAGIALAEHYGVEALRLFG